MVDIIDGEMAVRRLENATDAFEKTISTNKDLVNVPNVGDVPSMKKRIDDAIGADTFTQVFRNVKDWAQGEVVTSPYQRYWFPTQAEDEKRYMWFAPLASTANPITLGSSPINDDNWESWDVTKQDITEAQNEIIGGSIFKGSNGETVENGDEVEPGITHLRVLIGGKPIIVAMSPIASGVVGSLTDNGATIGATAVKFNNVGTKEFKYLYDSSGTLSVDGAVFLGDKVVVDNYHKNGNSGQLFFRAVPSGTGLHDGGKYIDLPVSGLQLEQNLKKPYNIKAWGAKGDGDQTLYPTNKTVDGGQVVIAQETHDGLCRDNLLRYIKSVGGGQMLLPAGEYRVYAYSIDLDFDLEIIGEGREISVMKSCDNSPVANGYGVLAAYGNNRRHIVLNSFSIDANADVRGGGEVRAYNFGMYGSDLSVMTLNFASRNAVIDCWYSGVDPDSNNSLYALNSEFDHAYRNTMSLVGAQNHTYVGCTLSGGGTVGTGTNPRACLDTEPNAADRTVRNIKFFGCTFKKAVNQLVINTWSDVDYEACTFDAGTDNPNSGVSGREEYPWLFNSSNSRVSHLGSTFLKKDNYRGVIKVYNENDRGEYIETQFSSFSSCDGEGVGMHIIGFVGRIHDTELLNSLTPVVVEGSGRQEVAITDMRLINVLDGNNFGTGASSSFAIKNTVEGDVYVDGLKALIKPDKLPKENFDTSAITRQYGFYLSSSGAADTTWRMRNIHMDGYYRLLPTAIGKSIGAGNFRDWGQPNLPPDDDTSKTITPGTPSYKDCTMRGDQ